jgi:hypothetical protein
MFHSFLYVYQRVDLEGYFTTMIWIDMA